MATKWGSVKSHQGLERLERVNKISLGHHIGSHFVSRFCQTTVMAKYFALSVCMSLASDSFCAMTWLQFCWFLALGFKDYLPNIMMENIAFRCNTRYPSSIQRIISKQLPWNLISQTNIFVCLKYQYFSFIILFSHFLA